MAGKFSVEAIFKATDRMTAPVAKMEKGVARLVSRSRVGLKEVEKVSGSVERGLAKVGAVALAAAAATGAAISNIVQTGAEFDRTLVSASAKFGDEAKRGTEGFERLRKAAEDIGAATEFNAQQGAEALKALASAGFTVEQSIAALPGVVDLATASEVDLGTATEMATKTMGAFNLRVEDAAQLSKNLTRVSDALAYAAAKTDASMSGLYESVQRAGPAANMAGVSIETFAAMASVMAGATIEGSDAGTVLKDTFIILSGPAKKAADQLRALGIKTKDLKGNLRDPVKILGELADKTSKMGTGTRSGVLNNIFGRIPVSGVAALMSGIEKVEKLRANIGDAGGAAAKMAATMRDTVAGDIDEFTSAIDGVKIAIFSMNNGAIRETLDLMTKWVGANKELIVQRVQDTVKWIGDNIGGIVKWGTRLAKVYAAFWAINTATKMAQTALDAYTLSTKLFALMMGRSTAATVANEVATAALGTTSAATSVSIASMRTALNAGAFASAINGVTNKFAILGNVVTALGLGVAIGTWLNDFFELDVKLNDILDKVRGISRATKAEHRGIKNGDEQHLSDGTVMGPDGKVIIKGYRYNNKQAEGILGKGLATSVDKASVGEQMFAANQLAGLGGLGQYGVLADPFYMPGDYVTRPEEPQMVAPRSTAADAGVDKSEITIKDETGRAEVTKEPKRGTMSIKLQPSGGL